MLMVGLHNSETPAPVESGAKASLGTLLGEVVEVTQATSAPLAVDVHPVGKAGGVTPVSKFWVTATVVFGMPILKVKMTSPKSVLPSWKWIVAVIVSPQFPTVEKVNG